MSHRKHNIYKTRRVPAVLLTVGEGSKNVKILLSIFCCKAYRRPIIGLGAVPLSCLVFELPEPPSPGHELKTVSFLVLAFLKSLNGLKE
jgi:hypothetical protein